MLLSLSVTMSEEVGLKRTLTLPVLTLYGLGTMVGGGFYALLGKVAGEAGLFTPLAILLAAIIAIFSAFSFAELSSRFPSSAGVARYVQEAFNRRWLASVSGWLVVLTGIVSAATLASAFAGFLSTFTDVPHAAVILAFVLVLGAIAVWGISESAVLANIITVIEVGGLVFVAVAGSRHFAEAPRLWSEMTSTVSLTSMSGVLLGGFIAFYAFIGFEDMVTVAEEVVDVRRTLPRAIVLALAMTTVLYIAVALVTIVAVPLDVLVESRSPLAEVVGTGAGAMTVIGMLAGINGALVQIVMAARMIYGMSGDHEAPRWFRAVHPRTRTPIRATVFVCLGILVLAWWFPLLSLAKATSGIILLIFALVNLSLWVLKRREPQPRTDGPSYPLWVPVLGFLTCTGFLAFEMASRLGLR